jgi:hypothetical protein
VLPQISSHTSLMHCWLSEQQAPPHLSRRPGQTSMHIGGLGVQRWLLELQQTPELAQHSQPSGQTVLAPHRYVHMPSTNLALYGQTIWKSRQSLGRQNDCGAAQISTTLMPPNWREQSASVMRKVLPGHVPGKGTVLTPMSHVEAQMRPVAGS